MVVCVFVCACARRLEGWGLLDGGGDGSGVLSFRFYRKLFCPATKPRCPSWVTRCVSDSALLGCTLLLTDRSCVSPAENLTWDAAHLAALWRSHGHGLREGQKQTHCDHISHLPHLLSVLGLIARKQHIIYCSMHRFPTCLLARKSRLRRLEQTNPRHMCV